MKHLKTLMILSLSLMMAFGAIACAAPQEEVVQAEEQPAEQPAEEPTGETELIVFAAASMTETLTEIAELYKTAAPGVTLVFNFDSSGTLKTQIQEGAE